MAFSNVMLAVHEKKTNPVDLYQPLRLYVSQHYSERDAVDHEEDLEAVQKMRDDIEKATDSAEVRRDLLQRYFRALCVMEPRFPVSTLSFTWFDAFKNKKATQQSIHFEKACVMFNLGAIYSQIGLNADRATPNGIKQACSSFQAAAGAFAFLRENLSLKASTGNSTIDISGECAGMLEKLMLAQAQECFFEKVVSDQKPPSLCGKIARQVSLYYEEAHAALTLPPLNQHLDRGWVAHVQLKAAQFHAEACYMVALDLHDKENIAEEIARLKVASSSLASAKKSCKGVVASFIDSVSKLETNINSNLERAIKENDRVYLMKIPSSTSLEPLPSVSLVKSTNLTEILDASKQKMFAGLVPDASTKALSRYTELLDELIRTQVEKLQQESEIARVKLKELDLPESIHALEGINSLPEQLQSDIQSIQLDGGLQSLDAAMRQLQDLRRVNEELLVQIEDLLQRESQQDAQLRSQFGSRWKQQPSSSQTKNLQDRLGSFAVKLKQAADVDSRIDRLIKDNWTSLSILEVKPIEASLPSLTKPIMSLNGDEDAIVGSLKQSLSQLEALGAQRAGLEDAMKEMKHKDNILPKLLSTSGSHEDLFKRELAKYDPIRVEVERNIEAQQKLIQQIMVQNNVFASVFNVEDYKVARDRTIKQLSAAVSKYHEIRDNIHNSGIKFYVSLQDAISSLKQQCTEFVTSRETESRDMIESMQRQLAGFSFQDSSTSVPYPSVSNQTQKVAPVAPPSFHEGNTSAPYTHQPQKATSGPPHPSYYMPPPHLTRPPPQNPYQTLPSATPQHVSGQVLPNTNAAGYQVPQLPPAPPQHMPGQVPHNISAAGYHQVPPAPPHTIPGYQAVPPTTPHHMTAGPPHVSTAYYPSAANPAPPASYYTVPQQPTSNYSYGGIVPRPGWHDPYYNAVGPTNPQQVPPQPSLQVPPTNNYYQPPQNSYYR